MGCRSVRRSLGRPVLPYLRQPEDGHPGAFVDHAHKLQSDTSAVIGMEEILPFSAVPGPAPSLPFIGTSWQYFPGGRYKLFKLHDANMDKYRRYGDILKEEFQWRRSMVQIFNPSDFSEVFRHQGKFPLRPGNEFVQHYRLSRPDRYSSVGLSNAAGEEWYRLRSALGPALLSLKSLDKHLPQQNRVCDDLVELLRISRCPRTHCVPDMRTFLYQLSLESIWMLCLDSRLGCLEQERPDQSDASTVIAASQRLFEAYQELYYGPSWWKHFPTRAYRKFGNAENAIFDIVSRYIETKLQKLRGSGMFKPTKHNSLLETLLLTEGLSEKEVILAVIDFIAGGIYTISNSLCFLLQHLALNPDIQETLHQELKRLVPDGVLTVDRLDRLDYLKACVKESFRLSSTVPGIMRILAEDTVLSGYHVPAGTPVFSLFSVTCHLPQYFPEPDKFKPERWLYNGSRSVHPLCLMPFGHGPRMCAGRKFSEMEMYVATAKLVYNFRLEYQGSQVDRTYIFIIVPSGPLPMVLRDR